MVSQQGIGSQSASSQPPQALSELASQLRAPTLCHRVSSTVDGIGQSVQRAYEAGGPQQQQAAGEPGSARWAVAEKSVFYRSTARPDAPYVEHTRSLQDGALGHMAHTLRGTERMGQRHGPQR